jgi:hypothetical protein
MLDNALCDLCTPRAYPTGLVHQQQLASALHTRRYRGHVERGKHSQVNQFSVDTGLAEFTNRLRAQSHHRARGDDRDVAARRQELRDADRSHEGFIRHVALHIEEALVLDHQHWVGVGDGCRHEPDHVGRSR